MWALAHYNFYLDKWNFWTMMQHGCARNIAHMCGFLQVSALTGSFKVYNAYFTGLTTKNWDTKAVSENKDHFLQKI